MTPQKIYQMFELNYDVIKMGLDGITNDESLIRPQPAGNSLNWVLGHVIASRNIILEMLDLDTVLYDDVLKPYQRGADPNDQKTFATLTTLMEAFEESQTRLKAGLDTLTPEQLQESDSSQESKWQRQSLADRLLFLQFHEAYHTGQTGLLRRIAGKEGAIP